MKSHLIIKAASVAFLLIFLSISLITKMYFNILLFFLLHFYNFIDFHSHLPSSRINIFINVSEHFFYFFFERCLRVKKWCAICKIYYEDDDEGSSLVLNNTFIKYKKYFYTCLLTLFGKDFQGLTSTSSVLTVTGSL